jgi:Ca2+-binding EF-hand superfamily protein
LGYELGYTRYSHSSQEVWAGAEQAFEVLDYFFGIVFTAELIIKVVGLRREWMRDYWNIFDALIVGFWLIEKLPREAVSMPENSNLLRAARMFRLVRLVRVIRTLQGFDSLYLLMTTLKGCLWILGWSTIFLYCIQMLIAFVMCFILNETYFNRDDVPEKEKLEVFEYFGSFTRAMLSMFELTLANWPPVCRLLVENVSEWFMLFFIAHKLTIGFAIIGVINGVFMQETFRVASTDDRIMVRQRERDLKVHTAKMSKLFSAADSSGDGEIDLEEFQEILQDPDIVLWLASMEITVRDPETFFDLLDVDGDGSLTPEEVVKGCLKMRGGAKSVDVLGLRKDVMFIKQCMYNYFGVTSRTLGRLSPASGG